MHTLSISAFDKILFCSKIRGVFVKVTGAIATD